MNEKVISGLKSVRRRFYMWAGANAFVAVCDKVFLEGKMATLFMVIVLVSVVIGGTISSFIEGYENE